MPKTTSNLPICIHCGTPRPADETLCPKCGNPWIDVRVAEPSAATAPDDPAAPDDGAAGAMAAAAAAAAAAATVPPPAIPPVAPPQVIPIQDTGEFGMDEWTLPPEPPSNRAMWLLPVALVVAVVAFWSFVYFGGDSPTTTSVAAQPSTTTTQAPTTTVAEVVEETTTSSTTTTTTVPYPPPSDWTASGDPLSTVELGLRAAGIGPIDFGSNLGDVAGQLVASLGDAEAAGDSNLCPPAETYWLQWGRLKAIFDGWEPDANFVSYRYEETDDASVDIELETLSGLQLGQTVAQLKSTYNSLTVTFELIDGQDHFRLVDGGDLLLWGPVSSTDDDGIVQGIYSPSPCPQL